MGFGEFMRYGWNLLSGYLPGGFALYLVPLVILFFIITSIYRHSGIMTVQRYRQLLLTVFSLLTLIYATAWVLALPERDTPRLICLPTLAAEGAPALDAEQRLLPLNLPLMFPRTGRGAHWQENSYLVQFAAPDSLVDLERAARVLRADYLLLPVADSTRLRLEVYRVRWHLPRLVASLAVCACDPLEAAGELQATLQSELVLPDPVATDSWLPEDLALILVEDTLTAIERLRREAAGEPLLERQLAALLLKQDARAHGPEIRGLLHGLAAADSASLPLQLLLARWYAQSEEWDKVEQALANALALDPQLADARYLAGFLLPERRERLGWPERQQLVDELAESEPAWLPGRLQQINWLERHGRLQEALRAVRELAFLLPRSYLARFRLGMIAFRTQNFLLAGNTYGDLARDYPDQPDVFYNLGINHFMTCDYRAGVEAFRRVLALGGESNAHLYLAKCYAWLGSRPAAIYHLRQRLLFRSEENQIQIDEAIKELSLYFPERQLPNSEE